MAVYGWNLAIAIATGNTTLWKPSPTTPLVSVAVTKLIAPILERNGLPGSVAALVCGDRDVGETLVASKEIQMVSFTGSEAVGKIVGKNVQDRFGKALLELGGNNAAIVDKDADLDLALQAVVFAAVGTAYVCPLLILSSPLLASPCPLSISAIQPKSYKLIE